MKEPTARYVPLRLPDPDRIFQEKRPLVGMTLQEMTDLLAEFGEPRFRARQLFQWVYEKGVKDYDVMTNLPAALRQKLVEKTLLVLLEQEMEQKDPTTQTSKFLFRLHDGQTVESVLMRHDYGNSACVTTQVGCRMGCSFCASTVGGLVRNLTAGEIVDQVIMMQKPLPPGERISSVVLMGSGEPMENYENVLKAIHLMHDPAGLNIGYRHITLSTSGLVPGIRRLAKENLPITLAVSLHAPNNELRSRLMPVNRLFPLEQVIEAAREYAETTGRRVTYEYLLIQGVNDQREHALELASLLKGSLAHVNLIPLNPVAERPQYRRPSREHVVQFRNWLEEAGIPVTIRREMGGGIEAACGQLRRRAARQRGPARS